MLSGLLVLFKAPKSEKAYFILPWQIVYNFFSVWGVHNILVKPVISGTRIFIPVMEWREWCEPRKGDLVFFIAYFLFQHVRDIKWSIENMRNFSDKYGEKPIKAIIEHVRDGSTVRCFLLPDFYHITLMLSGIRVRLNFCIKIYKFDN